MGEERQFFERQHSNGLVVESQMIGMAFEGGVANVEVHCVQLSWQDGIGLRAIVVEQPPEEVQSMRRVQNLETHDVPKLIDKTGNLAKQEVPRLVKFAFGSGQVVLERKAI